MGIPRGLNPLINGCALFLFPFEWRSSLCGDVLLVWKSSIGGMHLGPWKEESMSVSVREDYLSHGYGRICKLDSMKIPRMGDLVLKWILHGSSSIQLTIFQGGTCSFCEDLSRKFE